MREFWYQSFHQLALIEQILDGDPAAVRAYLAALLEPLVGPGLHARRRPPRPPRRRLRRAGRDDRLDRLVPRGLRRASRSALAETEPEQRIATPTTVLWQEHDPLFPRAWSDRLDVFFSDVDLRWLDGAGHFTPLEAPEVVRGGDPRAALAREVRLRGARAVRAALRLLPVLLAPERGEVEEVVRAAGLLGAARVGRVGVEDAVVDAQEDARARHLVRLLALGQRRLRRRSGGSCRTSEPLASSMVTRKS